MIISELIRKWFDLPEKPCASCEMLQIQLEVERARVNHLLEKVTHVSPSLAEISSDSHEELKPIQSGRKFVPFAVRQQMMEANDNKTLETLKEKWNEIHQVSLNPVQTQTNDELEKELLDAEVGVK